MPPPTRKPAVVERYSRRTRWFHTTTYLTVLVLLGTGWWLLAGQEGKPSPAARLTGVSDPTLHTYAGWTLTVLTAAGVTVGARAARTFLGESVRRDRNDLRWFLRWPAALITGRFPRHEGHFDPGQRAANLVMVALLAALVGSGVGLTMVVGGPSFIWLHRLHRWSTYLITPVLIGHILIASGLLPGYRGVARSMHLGGRLRVEVARRIWPGWLERRLSQQTQEELTRHCPLTISVGPLLLGALAPADRDQFQAHLTGCPHCQNELVQLAVLPGLLARVASPPPLNQ